MQKILEFKNEDWSKGISAQGHLPVGGLFQQMKGVDPFYNQGLITPSLTPDTITTTSTPKYLTNFNKSGTAYVYWHSDTEIKEVLKDSPYTQTDRSSRITFGGKPVVGATIWAGANGVNNYVYARGNGGSLRACPIPLETGTDVEILSGFNSSAMDDMPFCVGKKLAGSNGGYLYIGDNSRICQITSTTGTAGNTGSGFLIDGEFNTRDLINDGTYLVILADNNTQATANRPVGNYRCRIYFWDYVKSTADFIYEIDDSYLIAGKQLDGNIYFFGYKGLYVCNAGTPPQLIRPFTGFNGVSSAKPSNSQQLAKNKGSILWVDGLNNVLTNGNVYAYGNPTAGQSKIFYNPHINSNTSNQQNIIQTVGEQLWVGTSEPKIYVQNTGSTNGTSTITTIDKTMTQPHRYEYTKVVLSAPLSSGQSVKLTATSSDGSNTISAEETKSYNSSNPKQTLIFKRTNTGLSNTKERFEDIRLTITTVGASIQRVTTYATPLDDSSEDL